MLGGVMLGNNRRSWQGQVQELDFYSVKGIIENLLLHIRVDIEKIRFLRAAKTHVLLHPGRSCQVVSLGTNPSFAERRDTFSQPSDLDNSRQSDLAGKRWEQMAGHDLQILGWIGQIHPRLTDKLSISSPTYLFELDCDSLRLLRQGIGYREISNTPAVKRDITVDVPETVDYADVHSCIQEKAGRNLQELELISLFKPAPELKSLSFRLRMQDPQKTMTTEEVDALLANIRKHLSERLGAMFRL
jgi:phenylalanyl-tRNA synthetase beta subunit